jgi:IS30 family transposase
MAGIPNNQATIRARREKLWTLLTKGMKTNEIARDLNINSSTVSRDIKFLTAQSQNYLNDLARETLPFMYQTSIGGIQEVLKEAWRIYQSDNESINWFQRLAALKLAKECNESIFNLVDEGPSVMYLKRLQERVAQIENR